ncbi:MAG: glycosyltransferase family 2 protein [Desulfurococcaceae archaeon]
MTVKISFITFTYNNVTLLKGLLKNIYDVVDEIIIVDGYSTDGTIEVAESYNATVYLRPAKGFVEPERMFAISKARHEWILYLDPDERLNKKLKNELRNILDHYKKECSAFRIRRVNVTRTGKLLLGIYWDDFQVRIFKKAHVRYRGKIHEQPIVRGDIVQLRDEYLIIHLWQEGLWSQKQVKYAQIQVQQYDQPLVKSVVRKTLYDMGPFCVIPLWFAYVFYPLLGKKPINATTILYSIRPALYDGLVATLLNIKTIKMLVHKSCRNKRKDVDEVLGLF